MWNKRRGGAVGGRLCGGGCGMLIWCGEEGLIEVRKVD